MVTRCGRGSRRACIREGANSNHVLRPPRERRGALSGAQQREAVETRPPGCGARGACNRPRDASRDTDEGRRSPRRASPRVPCVPGRAQSQHLASRRSFPLERAAPDRRRIVGRVGRGDARVRSFRRARLERTKRGLRQSRCNDLCAGGDTTQREADQDEEQPSHQIVGGRRNDR